MRKPGYISAKPLSVLLGGVFADAFAKQGFASRELVTRWAEIAGADIAKFSEPLKIQHSSDAILQRVNRFFGWNAVGKIALRQAPLSRPKVRKTIKPIEAAAVAEVAKSLGRVEDDELREALARLGATIKRK
jgi:hypothetical protein